MATEKLTEYERKRLENIRQNDETMSSLKLQSIKAQVSASTKRPRFFLSLSLYIYIYIYVCVCVCASMVKFSRKPISNIGYNCRVETKSYKVSPKKQPKTQTPIDIRQSLRTRGLPPDAKGLSDEAFELPQPRNLRTHRRGCLAIWVLLA